MRGQYRESVDGKKSGCAHAIAKAMGALKVAASAGQSVLMMRDRGGDILDGSSSGGFGCEA